MNLLQKRGVFIVVEGLDGSGKTTQAKLLTAKLSQNYQTLYTAEPSQGKIGIFVRESCLYEKQRLPPNVEALLFAADRIEHVENEIKPALQEGRLVICDRYVYSSLAYQGSTGLSIDWIKEINKYAMKPDYSVFIDVPPEIVLQRLRRKKSVMETLEIQQKVRDIYLQFVVRGDLFRIKGSRSIEEVSEDLTQTVLKFLRT